MTQSSADRAPERDITAIPVPEPHTSRSSTVTTVVHLPADPSGSTLAAVIREIRLALLRGDITIDSRATHDWPPGPCLILDRLQRLTRRAGHRWHDLGADGGSPSNT